MDAVTEKGDPRTSKKAIDKASDKSGRVDSIVTARVPTEIKKQGNAVLEKIGATPPELINSAYDYAISHGSLPTEGGFVRPGPRKLTPGQKIKLKERGRRMLVKPGGDALNGRSLKDVLAEMRYADYEALS